MELTNIGNMDLEKGVIREGHKLFAWDAVQDCSQSDCCVAARCNYMKVGRCGLQVSYLRTLTDTICSTYKYLDDIQYFKIGMQIIPLYSHLLRLKLLEMSITDVVYENSKGIKFIHPVYKEIRQTLSTIHLMWKDLEINPGIPPIPDPSSEAFEESNPAEERLTMYGDPTYYKKLTETNVLKRRKMR